MSELHTAFEGLNMPYSLENEQSVLGAILLDPVCMSDDVVSTLRPEHFYLPQHNFLYLLHIPNSWAVRTGRWQRIFNPIGTNRTFHCQRKGLRPNGD